MGKRQKQHKHRLTEMCLRLKLKINLYSLSKTAVHLITCCSDHGWRGRVGGCSELSRRIPELLPQLQHPQTPCKTQQGYNTQQVLLNSLWPCCEPALSPRGTLSCRSAAADLSPKQLLPTSQLSREKTTAAKKLSGSKQGECQNE